MIYDAIKARNNRYVIGTLMHKDVFLSTSNDRIIISVKADQSNQKLGYWVEYLEVELKISIGEDGRGEGYCTYTYRKKVNSNHQYVTSTSITSTAQFNVRITNIGDEIEYMDYRIYYDHDNSYTRNNLTGGISYYDEYLSLCKEYYVEAILELALESFYSIVNE